MRLLALSVLVSFTVTAHAADQKPTVIREGKIGSLTYKATETANGHILTGHRDDGSRVRRELDVSEKRAPSIGRYQRWVTVKTKTQHDYAADHKPGTPGERVQWSNRGLSRYGGKGVNPAAQRRADKVAQAERDKAAVEEAKLWPNGDAP